MAKILKIYPNNPQENYINEVIKTLENGEIHEVNQLIEEGKKEKSDNREEVAIEDKI